MSDQAARVLTSGLTAGDCTPEGNYWACSAWHDSASDFEQVRVLGRRGSWLHVEWVTGPSAGAATKLYASDLWPAEKLEHARECRRRDLQIRALNQERPLDWAAGMAIDLCCAVLTGRPHQCTAAETRGLLRRLGRRDDLTELHELAYAEADHEYAEVHAPGQAWRELFQALAASEPQLVDERLEEVATGPWFRHEQELGAAIAMVRRWARLPPCDRLEALAEGADGSPARPDDVRRLRAIIELAAEALDEAGRPDQARRIRQAAFPDRFRRAR